MLLARLETRPGKASFVCEVLNSEGRSRLFQQPLPPSLSSHLCCSHPGLLQDLPVLSTHPPCRLRSPGSQRERKVLLPAHPSPALPLQVRGKRWTGEGEADTVPWGHIFLLSTSQELCQPGSPPPSPAYTLQQAQTQGACSVSMLRSSSHAP